MASEHYNKSIAELQTYFGISHICAQYIYHRALRSRRTDEKYLQWTVQLQNALVKADKCLGINWNKVFFGYETQNLLTHGINIDDMNDTVFRWTDEQNTEEQNSDSEWILVTRKKKKEKALLARKIGIFQ